MGTMILAVCFVTGLSIGLAIVLAVASRKLYVYEDPRIDEVADMLPGANCGACSLPGCRIFAEQTVAGEILPSKCPVGGADAAESIASFLGIEAGQQEQRVARLLCAGGTDVAEQVAEYRGQSSCRAAAVVTGGPKECTFGCLGLGDCETACTFDAITMTATGLPAVTADACTACGDCVEVCPRDLFTIMPISHKLLVQCKSILAGDEALVGCRVACTACGRCAADAPEGLIEMRNNLPVINVGAIARQTPLATYHCPTNAIVWLEGDQFANLAAAATRSVEVGGAP